jgi:hypothetical protein
MQIRLLFPTVLGLLAWTPGAAWAACPFPVPMYHALSFVSCADVSNVSALAYQLSDPVQVNTGSEDIACETLGPACFGDSGVSGDGRVTIESDWGNPAVSGCPALPDARRVVIVLQASDGEGLVLSLSGADPSLGYIVEAAHPLDPATSDVAPLVCGRNRPTLISSIDNGPAGTVTVNLLVRPPVVYSDCDPDTLGAALGTTCPDGFRADPSAARIVLKDDFCGQAVDLRRGTWGDSGVLPDAGGNVSLTLPRAPASQCVSIGYTANIGGMESGAVVGYLRLFGFACPDQDQDGSSACRGDCNDLNPSVHPGAPETCNGIDDDCDGAIDESATGPDGDGDGLPDGCDNCPDVPNPGQEDADLDFVGDSCDNCPQTPNRDQEDLDSDGVGTVCDNCPADPNLDQRDADFDRVGDVCDNCPLFPNPNQDPQDCHCDPSAPTINFSSPLGRGSGLVSWTTCPELDLVGFNIVTIDQQGNRTQLNPVLIPCEECVTGVPHAYSFIIPKHKSGRNIFLEIVRLSGVVQVVGPAVKE